MYLAADIGGTTGRVCAFEQLDQPPVARQEFGVRGVYVDDMGTLLRTIQDMTAGGTVQGISLVVAGRVNRDRTQILFATGLSDWVGQPIVEHLVAAFHCPVILGNDAVGAALGEMLYGFGRAVQANELLLVAWGTGVGGACVRTTNSTPMIVTAMEPGHILLDPNSLLRCPTCPQAGHLEALCGGANLPRRFGKATIHELSVTEWQRVAADMARGLNTILNAQPCKLVVFGGGIPHRQPWLLEEIRLQLEALGATHLDETQVLPSDLGERAAETGALALLRSMPS